MTEQQLCLSEKDLELACACLKAAARFGFITEEGLGAMALRCEAHNRAIEEKRKRGERVYGLTRFSLPAYLQYELTRFRLDFVSQKAADYTYAPLTGEKKEAFYQENKELFKRCAGDYFAYEDVEAVIEKRIREEEYYQYVQNLLCQRQ